MHLDLFITTTCFQIRNLLKYNCRNYLSDETENYDAVRFNSQLADNITVGKASMGIISLGARA